jgi:hypothetical protein
MPSQILYNQVIFKLAICEKFPILGDFNGMDCTDIVVGMARGDMGRLIDSYTRDRWTVQK